MRKIKISVCQFELKKTTEFYQFENQINSMIELTPKDSNYIVFPESVTTGLLMSFPDSDIYTEADLYLIDKYTCQYRELFSTIAKKRRQTIIGGTHFEKRGDKYYNIAYIFKADGTYADHKKTHIFPAEAISKTSEGDNLAVFEIGKDKIGIAICYEAEIPEISHILSEYGAEIIFCPSYTSTEHGFWRVRHCAHARAIENQVYFVHCPTIGEPGHPIPNGYGCASIISPCDFPWKTTGVVVEGEMNKSMVISGVVNIDELYLNRQKGAAPTFQDRKRRQDLYSKYAPYKSFKNQLEQ